MRNKPLGTKYIVIDAKTGKQWSESFYYSYEQAAKVAKYNTELWHRPFTVVTNGRDTKKVYEETSANTKKYRDF